MTIKEVSKELDQLENDLEYYLNEKEILLSKVLPKASDIKGETVDGGKRSDRMLEYVENLDEKKINETIDYIYARKNNLQKWLDNELRILGEYDPLEKKIVMYREQYNMKWELIGESVGYSDRQCKRIYKKYKQFKEKRKYVNMS